MKKLALLLPLLALATAGCGERSQYVAAEIERDITNADHSESVEIRVPQSRKPLYYATTWLFCTEESSAEFYRDLTGPHYKSEFNEGRQSLSHRRSAAAPAPFTQGSLGTALWLQRW